MHIYRFCYTHARPVFDQSTRSVYFWVGDEVVPDDLKATTFAVREMFHDLDFYRYWLYGGAASLAALRALRAMPDFDASGIIVQSSYRKFVSHEILGAYAENFQDMCIANASDIVAAHLEYVPPTGFLLSRPYDVSTIFQQYAGAHRAPDLLRYCALCCELGVLTSDECLQFLQSDFLLPGGCELGAMPVAVWVDIMTKIERVTLAFCKSVQPVDMSPYQRRAVAFCNERLESFLLVQQLVGRFGYDLPAELFGYLINAAGKAGNAYTVGT